MLLWFRSHNRAQNSRYQDIFRMYLNMTTADYLVLFLVVAAYLGWIFQGEGDYTPRKPASEE